MTKKLDIHFFTSEELAARDRRLVARTNQATTAYVVRKMVKMNSGQQLNAARDKGRSLLWSEKTLDSFLDHADKD